MKDALAAFDLMVELATWSRSTFREDLNRDLDRRGAVLIPILPVTTPYWVSADFTALVVSAASSFPRGNVLRPDERPSPEGLVVFDRPVPIDDEDPDRDRAIGIYWIERVAGETIDDDHYQVPEGARYLQVVPISRVSELRGSVPAGIVRKRFGTTTLPDSGAGWLLGQVPKPGTMPQMLAILRSFWALCGQRVGSVSQHLAPRSAARRALRVGVDLIPEVAVVTLRRPAGRERDEREGPGFVDWSHRWIVGGHWRNQWLPSEQHHEPRWIAPYVKGPENKPLVTDRVYQLIR